MATKTATGGAWTTAGNWSPSGVPTSADDVIIPSGVNQNIPTAATVACRSLTIDSGATFTGNASATAQIGTSAPGPSNVALSISSGATVTWTSGTIQFVSTSTTQQTISTGGKTIPAIQQSGVGSNYVLSDSLTCGTFQISAGTFDTASYTITWASFAQTGAGTKVFSPGSSVITCTSGNTPVTHSGTNFTISSNTCEWRCTPAVNQASWSAASGSYHTVKNNTSVVGNFATTTLTCVNFEYVCDANQTRVVQLAGDLTCTGTFTITGNSAINRPTVWSAIAGVARTITAAATAISGGVDWQDITGAGAAAPFVASSGFMGDAQGNTNITFTTPATQTRDGTSGAWSVAARWTSRVPLPQDDVVINGSSGNITQTDILTLGRNIDFTGYTGTITRNSTSSNYQIYGNVTLSPTANYGSNPNTFYVDYRGRGAQTITSNGVPLFQATSNQRMYIYAPGGSYTFVDDVHIHTSSSGTASLTVFAGTLDLGAGRSHNIATLASSTTTAVRAITCGAGTSMTSQVASTLLNFSPTNLTTTLEELTLICAVASAATRTITAGIGCPLKEVIYTVDDSPGTLAFSASSGHKIKTLTVGPGRAITATSNAPLQVQNWSGGGQDFGGQKMFGQSAGNLLSTPHSAALNIGSSAADITIDVKVTLADWTPGSRFALVCKINSGLTAGYLVRMETSGAIGFFAAGGQITSTVSAATVFNDGDTGWIRVQRRTSDGRCQFFTSPDGSTWTQLGADVTLASGTNIGSNTEVLYLGSRTTGNDPMGAGQMFHRCRIYSDLTATTRVASPDFEAKPVGDDTLTDAEGNVWTIGAAIVNGDGRLALQAITAGTPAYLQFAGARPVLDYMKVKDVWSVIPDKMCVGSNSQLVSGNTNVSTGAAPSTPYIVQVDDATASTAVLPFPTTTGNTLVAAVSLSGGSPSWVDPTGFTLIDTSPGTSFAGISTYRKTADGTETGFTTTSTGGTVQTSIVELAGLGTPTVATGENSNAGATSLAAASSAPSAVGSSGIALAFWVAANTMGATASPPDGGFSEFRTASQQTLQRRAAKPITAPGAVNSTYGWATSRPAASQMLLLETGTESDFLPQAIRYVG